ncbi:MAG: hypothetical protein BWY32_02904 [bacterium ADurb.Bin243]|nr:MAG: hypothetical protein BWY32_02904 [bacterium ADurb.Bin243]
MSYKFMWEISKNVISAVIVVIELYDLLSGNKN